VTAYDRVLAKLEALGLQFGQQDEGSVMAQCPAHVDRTPSLSVTDTGEGRALAHCHAGCDTKDVMTALGLTMADLFDNKREVTYTYDDGRKVHRHPDKTFHQSGVTSEVSLYRRERVIAAEGQTIYVVEGEEDVHAVERAGAVATCSPMGAGKWHKVNASPLAGANVVVVQDRDAPGRKHAAQVVKSLQVIAKSVRLVEARDGKDATDHLTHHGYGLDGFQKVNLEDAVEREAREQAKALLVNMHGGSWLDAQVFEPLRWMVPGIVPEGATILVGGPKVGKSWLAYGIALAVAGGGAVLGTLQVQQRPVLMLALEDGDRRLQQRGRTLMVGRPLPGLLDYVTRLGESSATAIIRAWLLLLPAGGPDPLVILDTYGRAVPDAGKEETSYLRDYRFASELKEIADDRPGMALLVLHHDRKATADDFVTMVSGTNGIAGAFDTIMMLTRKRLDPQGLLKITGRDVPEKEYAVTSTHGPWSLAGDSLAEAAKTAEQVNEDAGLGESMLLVLGFVKEAAGVVTPKEVAEGLGMERRIVSMYLLRLVKSGRLLRPSRGTYTHVDSVDSVDAGLQMPRPEWATSTQSTESTPSLEGTPGVSDELCECGNPVEGPGHLHCVECTDAVYGTPPERN
jgi:hypothetical protein